MARSHLCDLVVIFPPLLIEYLLLLLVVIFPPLIIQYLLLLSRSVKMVLIIDHSD